MTTKLNTSAVEESTYIILVSFRDEEGQPVVPQTVKWTLATEDRVVINGREDVDITTLAATVPIVLTGADLVYEPEGDRYLLVEAIYNSAKYGDGLHLKEEFRFKIRDLKNVYHVPGSP